MELARGEVVFEVSNLTKYYRKKKVVEALSFQGRAGQIVGFLGPNGAGKTTTIKMMTGLISIDEGTARICGHDIRKELEEALSCVGAVVETPYLYEQLTGLNNLRIFAKAKGASEGQLTEMVELTGLGNRLKDKVKEYSLGMKQRLGLGVALMNDPPLLILDEPTNGLDPLAIRELREFLKKLAKERHTCVFISSHMLWEMEKLCDHVIIINAGRYLGEVTIEELKERKNNLEDYYIECVKEQTGESETVCGH